MLPNCALALTAKANMNIVSQLRENQNPPAGSRILNGKDFVFNLEVDVWDDDLCVFANDSTSTNELEQHFAYMTSDARRKTEVSLKRLTPGDKSRFVQAMNKEMDQWISNSVFKIARRTGIPISRIMKMRWVLTWKEVDKSNENPDGYKAKARLVAQ